MRKLLLAFIMLFVCTISAADIGIINISDFSGGLNTRDGSGNIADNEVFESVNCYLDRKAIVKRNGFTRYNDSTRVDADTVGTGIFNATFTAGDQVIATAGDNIAKKGTNSWSDITGTVTLTAGKLMLFTMVYNNLVGVNGTDTTWYYDGSTTAKTLTGANIPTAPSACESFKNRLFLAQGRYLYWSNYLGAWNTFHPDDFQNFEENITGLKVIGTGNQSVLMVFTQHSITQCIFDAEMSSVIGGRGTFRFEKITNSHGCVSPYTIQECLLDDGSIVLIWADLDGLKAYQSGNILKLTDKIQPTWDGLSFSRLDDAVATVSNYKRWYLMAYSESGNTENNKVLCFDLRNMTVGGIWDWDINALNTITSGNIEYIIGADNDGYWNIYDSGTNDNGAAIDSYFYTKTYDGNEPFTDKGFKAINWQHEYKGNYALGYTIIYDFINDYAGSYVPTNMGLGGRLGTFILGINKVGASSGSVIAGREIKGRGKTAQIKISNGGLDETFEIYRLSLLFERGNLVIYK
jgi:hypothetical protein